MQCTNSFFNYVITYKNGVYLLMEGHVLLSLFLLVAINKAHLSLPPPPRGFGAGFESVCGKLCQVLCWVCGKVRVAPRKLAGETCAWW